MKKLYIALIACVSPLSVWASVPCQTLKQITPSQTPVVLTQSMLTCVQNNRYSDAVDLFNMAGVFAKFDTLRVPDKTAHQAYSVLKMQAGQSLSEEQLEKFDAQTKKSLESDGYHEKLCATAKKVGKPSYTPTYMINHGMAAFTGRVLPNDEVPPALGSKTGFDENHAWNHVLDTYLKCPQ